jgi:hypothetical protein
MQEFRSAAVKHRGRLVAVFFLTAAFLVIEIVGGIVANSLALLADAGHMATDVIGFGLALFAIWLAARPATTGRTFGWYRVDILAAVINAMIYNCHSEKKPVHLWSYDLTANTGVWKDEGTVAFDCPDGTQRKSPLEIVTCTQWSASTAVTCRQIRRKALAEHGP